MSCKCMQCIHHLYGSSNHLFDGNDYVVVCFVALGNGFHQHVQHFRGITRLAISGFWFCRCVRCIHHGGESLPVAEKTYLFRVSYYGFYI